MNSGNPNQLSGEELERYARHIVLPEIGGAGQQRLKKARVLVIGAGGLGAPVLQYLAAAGVGTLGIVDDDTVSLSNLQRQVIHTTERTGMAKVESAKLSIESLNPHTAVETHQCRLSSENADALFDQYDVIVDGSDNFETRYLAADTAERHRKPLVTAAVGRFDGSLTVLKPWECDAEGTKHPGYRDLFPSPPPAGTVPSCAEAGILGALTGVMGTLQAMEVIKLITGAGQPLLGKLLMYNALDASFQVIRYGRRS
ncbi:MAG: molybdopterin-synthase adenylyltransferase MoeB [Rhizobiaceae bacterium]